MNEITHTQDVDALLKALENRYQATGQDLETYLKSLYFSKYMPYWEYIQVDTLLTLQKTRTQFPDEVIFIIYHQITELYFRLSLHELEQIAAIHDTIDLDSFMKRLNRINRYFINLEQSFDVMSEGMDVEQFLAFRLALTPSSGFQSAQYRMIEFRATDLINLTGAKVRHSLQADQPTDELYAHVYWNEGGIEMETGKPTHTLQMFKAQYDGEFAELAREMRDKNLWKIYQRLAAEHPAHADLDDAMRAFDAQVNVNWPMAHLKTANRYLRQPEGGDIKATGGTNWRTYLPPAQQRRIFYPTLWTEAERETWGRQRLDL